MSEKIVEDLARRLHDKMADQMADYVDLCERSGCNKKAITDHMLAVLVRETMIGFIAYGMNKKEVLHSMGISYDLVRPEVEKLMKKERRR